MGSSTSGMELACALFLIDAVILQAVAWAPGGMRCGVATGSGRVVFGSVLDLEAQNGTSQARDSVLKSCSGALRSMHVSAGQVLCTCSVRTGPGALVLRTGRFTERFSLSCAVCISWSKCWEGFS
jgi:hypothetical protein